MSRIQSLFAGDHRGLEEVDLEAPLQVADSPCCIYYQLAYEEAARQADGGSQEALVYTFLADLTGFMPSFDTGEEPYRRKVDLPGHLSPLPSELSPDDLDAVKKIAESVEDAALRARLLDILWVCRKDHVACGEAAGLYADAADLLISSDSWTYADDHYRRGLQLARTLGAKKDLYLELETRLLKKLEASFSATAVAAISFLRLAIHFRCGDSPTLAAMAAKEAQKADDDERHALARDLWEIAAELFKRSADGEKEKACRLAVAKSYFSEACLKGDGPSGSGLVGAHFQLRGVEALRRVGGDSAEVERQRAKLTEYQIASRKEMKTISTEFDIAELQDVSRNHVSGQALDMALFRFTLGRELEDPDSMREQARKNAEAAPLSHLLGRNLVDGSGRTVAVQEGLYSDEQDAENDALEAYAFNAARFFWDFRAAAYIEPARRQIVHEHHPSLDDLSPIVRNNPFIPPGHEWIFLRGLHAGLHGDFLLSASLLVPQIENSLRHILEMVGVDVTNLKSDGTQPVKMLGQLLCFNELEEMLGAAACFELRGHLIEKNGFDFRNHLCHGFLSDAEANSTPAASIWWLVLRLCLAPLLNSRRQQEDTEGGDGA